VVKTIQQFVFQSAWKISFVILGVDQSVSYFVYDRVGVYINYMNFWHLYWIIQSNYPNKKVDIQIIAHLSSGTLIIKRLES
jgi:hypothetical protein